MSGLMNKSFSENPVGIKMQRSAFNRNHTHKTTFNAGKLVPILCEEVLPGDTFKVKNSFVVRMSTPIYPVMDNAFLDIHYFFVPSRLLWAHWKEFCGENTSSYWYDSTPRVVPQLKSTHSANVLLETTDGFQPLSVADYFGIPTQVKGLSVNALPFRAYALIWNEWFRDENLQGFATVFTDDTTRDFNSITGSLGDPMLTAVYGGDLLPVNKFHDYFTSCLPAPQKGPSVSLLGSFGDGLFPVRFAHGDNDAVEPLSSYVTRFETPLYGRGEPGGEYFGYYSLAGATASAAGSSIPSVNLYNEEGSGGPDFLVYPYADLSSVAVNTINSLRFSFQLQKFYEKMARGGSRYTEILREMFGVTSPDSRLQRPEYLGGTHQRINVQQVLQTSSTDATSPQGHTAAFSCTSQSAFAFGKSFTEHGYILGFASVRTDHTYQQGIARMWSRKDRTDFYWPVFANIGEQGVLKKEIYADGTSSDDEVFGYQEAWAEYRYNPSRVSGAFRSNYTGTLDSWHYADKYLSRPALSDLWIRETDANVKRTLAVQTEPQFIADFYFEETAVRPMPVYSMPGLIDHH